MVNPKIKVTDSFQITGRGTAYVGLCSENNIVPEVIDLYMDIKQPIEINGKVFTIVGIEKMGRMRRDAFSILVKEEKS